MFAIAAFAKSMRYGWLGNAKMLGNVAMANPSIGHSKSFVKIPCQWMMFLGMRDWRHYLKILKSIVQFVAVLVMNIFRSGQLSPKMFLHNSAMLKLRRSISADFQISGCNCSCSSERIHAVVGTKRSFIFSQFARLSFNKQAAKGAWNGYSCFTHDASPNQNVVLDGHWRSNAFGRRHYIAGN